MGDILEPNIIARWRHDPKAFIRDVLRNPKTGKPF